MATRKRDNTAAENKSKAKLRADKEVDKKVAPSDRHGPKEIYGPDVTSEQMVGMRKSRRIDNRLNSTPATPKDKAVSSYISRTIGSPYEKNDPRRTTASDSRGFISPIRAAAEHLNRYRPSEPKR